MNFETETPIDIYVESINNRIFELDYMYNLKFNNMIEKKFNSIFNKFLFKKNKEEIKLKIQKKIDDFIYGMDGFDGIYNVKRYQFDKNDYIELLRKLNMSKDLGNERIKISSRDLEFINRYSNNSKYVVLLKEEYKKLSLN